MQRIQGVLTASLLAAAASLPGCGINEVVPMEPGETLLVDVMAGTERTIPLEVRDCDDEALGVLDVGAGGLSLARPDGDVLSVWSRRPVQHDLSIITLSSDCSTLRFYWYRPGWLLGYHYLVTIVNAETGSSRDYRIREGAFVEAIREARAQRDGKGEPGVTP